MPELALGSICRLCATPVLCMQLGRCLGALIVKGAMSPAGAMSAVLEASGEGFEDEPGERLIEGPNAASLLKALFGEWRAGSGAEAVQAAWQSKLGPMVSKEVRSHVQLLHVLRTHLLVISAGGWAVTMMSIRCKPAEA